MHGKSKALRPAAGLAQACSGAVVQTVKPTIAEFKARHLADLAAALTY